MRNRSLNIRSLRSECAAMRRGGCVSLHLVILVVSDIRHCGHASQMGKPWCRDGSPVCPSKHIQWKKKRSFFTGDLTMCELPLLWIGRDQKRPQCTFTPTADCGGNAQRPLPCSCVRIAQHPVQSGPDARPSRQLEVFVLHMSVLISWSQGQNWTYSTDTFVLLGREKHRMAKLAFC